MRSEAVDHPAHYQSAAGIEAIDVMETYDLGLHLGTAFKYLARAGRKDDLVQDLEKSRWYLRRWLDQPFVHFPMAGLRVIEWATPDTIVTSFRLYGSRAVAVRQLLDFAIYGEPEGSVRAALSAVAEAIEEARAPAKELELVS